MKNELKRDPILQKIIESVGYIKEQKQYFIQGVIVLAIIITAIGYFNTTAKANEELASSLSGKAQNSFIDNESSNALANLQMVLDNYSASKAADHATIMLLQEAIRNNDLEKINELVNAFNNNAEDNILESSILQVKGMIALNQNDFSSANNSFVKASSISSSKTQKHQNLLSSVFCQIKLGVYEDAKSTILELLSDEDIAFNEKNIAEEYQAELQFYLND
jgi:hypothetical protein